MTWSLGSLASSGSATLTLVVNVDPGRTAGLSNTASVTSDTPDPSLLNNSATQATAVATSADVSIIKTDAPDPVVAGRSITYTLAVSNNGPSTARSVAVSDPLPAGTSFVSADNGGSVSAGTVTWALGDLAAGASTTLTLVVDVDAARLAGITNTASVSSTTADPDNTNNSSTQGTGVSTSADLSITKSDSPDPVVPGNDITYTISVANAGPSTARSVSVSDPIPAGTSFVSADNGGSLSAGTVTWSLGDLAPGANRVLSLTVHVHASTTADVSNTAVVSSTTSDPDPTNDQASAATTVLAQADLGITKSDSPDPVVVGSNLTYTITATNDGPSEATGVVVTDPLPAGTSFVSAIPSQGSCALAGLVLTCSIGTVASGDAATIGIVVTPNAGSEGTIVNTAQVSGDQADQDLTNNSATQSTTVTDAVDVSIQKSDNPDPVVIGDPLTYTIDVHNAGPSAATGVDVIDDLPSSVAFVSATPTQGSCSASGSTVTCALGAIASGGSATVVVVVTPNSAGSITNTASVAADQGDVDLANNTSSQSTTVTPLADLRLTKTDDPDPVDLGSPLTYTLLVRNLGPSDATSVQVVDDLPASVVFVSATPSQGTCGGSGGTVTCDLGSVADGGSATVAVVVTPTVAGTIVNSASVTAAEPDPFGGNTDDESTTVDAVAASADLEVTKTDSADPVAAGDTYTYTLTTTNHGPSAASGVVVSDTLPAPLSFVSATPSQGGCSESGGTVTCTLGAIAAGADATVDIAVLAAPGSEGVIVNTADIGGDQADPNAANDHASESTTILPSADVSLTKADAPDPVSVGDPLTYTLTATNSGPSSATGVQIVDPLPSGITFVSVTPTQGSCANLAGTVMCDLGALAAGGSAVVAVVVTPTTAGTISNDATVTANEDDPVLANNDASQSTTVDASADLSVTKADDADPVVVGDDVTYTIVVANAGPSDATNVELLDALPASVTLLAATPDQGSCVPAGSLVQCALGDIAAGSSATVVVGVRTTADGTITDVAQATGAESDPVLANNQAIETTTVEPLADLRIDKSDGVGAVIAGSSTTYSITVANEGPSTVPAGVVIADDLPVGTSGAESEPDCAIAAGTFSCTTSSKLDPGDTVVYQLTVHVPPGFAGAQLSNTAAIASSPAADPDPSNDSATDVDSVGMSADLSVTKTDAPDPVVAGQTLTYTITVADAGPSDATGVQVVDALPAGVSFVSATPSQGTCAEAAETVTCDLATIAAAGVATVSVLVTPMTDGSLSNSATVFADQPDPVPANNVATQTTTVTPAADVSLTKTDSPDPVVPGHSLTYTLVSRNAGPSDATGVQVVDALPGSVTFVSATPTQGTCAFAAGVVTCDLGTIGIGASATIDVVVTPTTDGAIRNDASIAANEPDPDPANNDASAATTVASAADLAVSKTDGVASVAPGAFTVYSVSMNNLGPSVVPAGVVVTDVLPPGAAPSESEPDCTLGAGTMTCTTSTALAPGQGVVYQVRVDLATSYAAALLVNTAFVSSSPLADPNAANDSATDTDVVAGSADLSITKSAAPDPVPLGQPLTYLLHVRNDGPSDASGVRVVDPLPASVGFVSATPTQGGCSIAGGTVTCDLGVLPATNAAIVTIVVTPASGGPLTNSASVSADQADPDPTDNTAGATTSVLPLADVRLSKSASSGSVPVGGTIDYTLTAHNAGPSDATNVVVRDPLPASATLVAAYPSQGTCSGTHTVTCSLGALAVGASASISITVTPTRTGRLRNTAAVSADETDSAPSNNRASATVDVVAAAAIDADLRLSKSADVSSAPVGGLVVYDISVRDRGPGQATNVVVVDLLPAGLSFVSAQASIGAYDASTGRWTVGTVEVGRVETLRIVARVAAASGGSIVNAARVLGLDQLDPNRGDDTAIARLVVDVSGTGTAWTGAEIGWLVALMTLLLCAGVALLVAGRRPKTSR